MRQGSDAVHDNELPDVNSGTLRAFEKGVDIFLCGVGRTSFTAYSDVEILDRRPSQIVFRIKKLADDRSFDVYTSNLPYLIVRHFAPLQEITGAQPKKVEIVSPPVAQGDGDPGITDAEIMEPDGDPL